MGKYDESSIHVLSDRDHVRQRPTMYISSERPSYQMFTEILDNSLDEAMNGHASVITVKVDYESNTFTVVDNGRGLPQGLNKELNLPTPQVIYTKLNSGGKYDRESYGYAGGLNGVGSSVVNFLSKEFQVKTWRPSVDYPSPALDMVVLSCSYGEISSYEEELVKDMSLGKSGTSVYCVPDTGHKIFQDKLSDYESDIHDRLLLMKSLLPKVNFIYNEEVLPFLDFSSFIRESASPLFEKPLVLEYKDLRVAMNWSQENNKYLTKCFCNSVYNPSGGDHEKGVHDAIVEFFGSSDYSLGISFVVSAMYPDVEFDTQVKLKAVSKELRTYVKETTVKLLKKYFVQFPESREQIEELIKSKRRDIDKKNNKSNVKRNRRSTFLSSLGVSGFSDCTTKNREDAELYIVEGNSAAGSAIQARDVETAAILPIRGKIINALNSDIASLYKNAEVSQIMSSINAGTFEDVDLSKARYGKVIIFADADEDGKNISCLLLSLFCTMTPALVDAGMLYLAQPPLYGTHVKGKWIPINSDEMMEDYLAEGYEIQRYKGLGEMSPEQLRIACMDMDTRRMVQIETTPDCYDMVKNIMGGNSKYRKELLKNMGVLID